LPARNIDVVHHDSVAAVLFELVVDDAVAVGFFVFRDGPVVTIAFVFSFIVGYAAVLLEFRCVWNAERLVVFFFDAVEGRELGVIRIDQQRPEVEGQGKLKAPKKAALDRDRAVRMRTAR
jgi:hypothetical protein